MADITGMEAYTAQIDEIVRGFMNLWTKFGAVLPDELGKIRENIKDSSLEYNIHPDTHYEQFFRVSSTLYNGNKMTMGELSNALSVPMSTATRIVDWLVDGGCVQRLSDPEDRRIVLIDLTDSGRELHRTIQDYIRQRLLQMLSVLTDEERNTVFELIFKIAAIVRKVTK